MATPKLFIQYSWIYDDTLHRLRKEKYKPSTETKLTKYAIKLNKYWHKKYNNKVFKLMSQVSGLKWKRKELDAYVVKKTIPFSKPLTLYPEKNMDNQVETIIHELCHNLIVQNLDRIDKKPFRKFKKEHITTFYHLLVYAIEIPVLQKLFSKQKVDKFLKATKKYHNGKHYWRAVQLVQKHTPQYFLNMLK